MASTQASGFPSTHNTERDKISGIIFIVIKLVYNINLIEVIVSFANIWIHAFYYFRYLARKLILEKFDLNDDTSYLHTNKIWMKEDSDMLQKAQSNYNSNMF